MPITVSMKAKRVVNDPKNDLVVTIYKDVLKLKNMLNEDESKSGREAVALNPKD